jgi:flagellin
MSYSFQTNVTSLLAQENLRVNSQFQSQTITRLTSGFRINSSADDAAGLAVANGLRSDTAELTQGVQNANNGTSILQIIDGGLNNISNILDRLKTLATESASSTFSGDRGTLNNEYQSLLTEITRQASNIGLSTGAIGGRYNADLGVYIGGGQGVQANGNVSIDLSGNTNQVDSNALGIGSSSVSGGGTNLISGAAVDLRVGTFLAAGTQAFVFNFGGTQVTATVGGGASGLSGQALVDQLNTQISAFGVSASIDATTGQLNFNGGSTAFNVMAATASAGTAIATATGTATNTSLTTVSGTDATFSTTPIAGGPEVLTFTIGGNNTVVSLATGTTLAQAISQINGTMGSLGVHAQLNTAGTGLDLQGTAAFTVSSNGGGTTGVFALNTNTAQAVTAPVANAASNGNALLALTAITTAIGLLGTVQGKVGAGENMLNYATQLAQSQISSFSAAESAIRDADVASEAANLTKAQILEQSSVAALAQANAAPQALLKLLQ